MMGARTARVAPKSSEKSTSKIGPTAGLVRVGCENSRIPTAENETISNNIDDTSTLEEVALRLRNTREIDETLPFVRTQDILESLYPTGIDDVSISEAEDECHFRRVCVYVIKYATGRVKEERTIDTRN